MVLQYIPAVLSSVLGIAIKEIKEVRASSDKRAAIKRRILAPRASRWGDHAARVESAEDIISAVYGFSNAGLLDSISYWFLSRTVLKGKLDLVHDFLNHHYKYEKDPTDWRALSRLLKDILAVL